MLDCWPTLRWLVVFLLGSILMLTLTYQRGVGLISSLDTWRATMPLWQRYDYTLEPICLCPNSMELSALVCILFYFGQLCMAGSDKRIRKACQEAWANSSPACTGLCAWPSIHCQFHHWSNNHGSVKGEHWCIYQCSTATTTRSSRRHWGSVQEIQRPSNPLNVYSPFGRKEPAVLKSYKDQKIVAFMIVIFY